MLMELRKISASKTVRMLAPPNKLRIGNYPNVYIGAKVVKYATEFRYIGHLMKSDLTDDKDICR